MKKFKSTKIALLLTVAVLLCTAIIVSAQPKADQAEESESAKNGMSCPLMEKQGDKNKSPQDCPLMKKKAAQTSESKMDEMANHPGHHEMVMKNGEKAMGFSQTATTHHFLITKDGGAIQVEANDAKDTENRNKIRAHLTEIAEEFQNGIFTTPFAVHGQIPPGVPEVDKLKNEIQYSYEETEKGARVRISTKNPKALAAIQQFLKFQIEDHQTGDLTSIKD